MIEWGGCRVGSGGCALVGVDVGLVGEAVLLVGYDIPFYRHIDFCQVNFPLALE